MPDAHNSEKTFMLAHRIEVSVHSLLASRKGSMAEGGHGRGETAFDMVTGSREEDQERREGDRPLQAMSTVIHFLQSGYLLTSHLAVNQQ